MFNPPSTTIVRIRSSGRVSVLGLDADGIILCRAAVSKVCVCVLRQISPWCNERAQINYHRTPAPPARGLRFWVSPRRQAKGVKIESRQTCIDSLVTANPTHQLAGTYRPHTCRMPALWIATLAESQPSQPSQPSQHTTLPTLPTLPRYVIPQTCNPLFFQRAPRCCCSKPSAWLAAACSLGDHPGANRSSPSPLAFHSPANKPKREKIANRFVSWVLGLLGRSSALLN